MRLIRRALVVGVLAVGACATGDGMQSKLYDTTRAYNRHLRWSDFDRAAQYLPTTSRESFLNSHESLADKLVIVDYEITRLRLDREAGLAASRVRVSWHTERSPFLKETSVDQTWQWHEGNFVLVDEVRSGGTPLGAFAETGGDDHPYLPGVERYRKAYGLKSEAEQKRKPRGHQRRRGGRSRSTR